MDGGAPKRATKGPMPQRAPRKPRLAIAIVIAALGIEGVLLAFIVSETRRLERITVSDLVNHRARYTGRSVIVSGVLLPGSLVRYASPCSYRFELHDAHATILVRFRKCVRRSSFAVEPHYRLRLVGVGRSGMNHEPQ
jgi:hypothetical protein